MNIGIALLPLISAFYAALVFSADASKEDGTARAQQIVTSVCAACHSSDGNSASPANPVLAGQHRAYTTKQLVNFKSGERKSPVMSAIAAPLSDQEMSSLGLYFQQQKARPRSAKNPELVKLGQQIYRGGVLDKGIAACASCHGPSGAGIPSQFPRVAAQFSDYTIAQLRAFRGGERSNDPNNIMRSIAAKLSDREVAAVAEYMSGLR